MKTNQVLRWMMTMPRSSSVLKASSSWSYVRKPTDNTEIEGLIYIPNYISTAQGNELLTLLDSRPWFDELLSRRIQCYGIHYYFTKLFHPGLQPMRKSPFLLNDLSFVTRGIEQDFGIKFARDEDITGLPEYYEEKPITSDDLAMHNMSVISKRVDDPINQCLVQEYYQHPIAKHVDNTNVFGKEIVCISLANECEMDFESVENPEERFKLLLEPNSLLIMSKDGRYHWKHGIKRKKHHPRRISLTFRHLLYNNDQEVVS